MRHLRRFDSPKEILRKYGFNCTEAQIATLEILIQAEHPVSRDYIFQALGSGGPDKTTIYRILERFCEKNLIHKAYVDKRAWEYELADKCSDHQCHPHFKCTNCGKIICLHDVCVPLVEGLKGFIFQRQKMIIEGIGPECAKIFDR